jgi:hypothetical protein
MLTKEMNNIVREKSNILMNKYRDLREGKENIKLLLKMFLMH